MSLILVVFLLVPSAVLTFNFDLRYPHVYHSPQPGDYFGFSVALHPGNHNDPMDEPWIMVGAPRSYNPTKPKAKNPGVVLRCTLNQPCSTLNLDPNGDRLEQLDGSMLGAAQDMLGGRYVSCAPRWKDSRNTDNYTMLGVAYWGASVDAKQSPAEKLLPLNVPNYLTIESTSRSGKIEKYPVYVYGQAGFSAHFPNITKEGKELVLGAPGAYNWIGTTILYRDSKFSSGLAKRRRKRGVGVEAFAEGPIIPFSFSTNRPSPLKSFGLFGYSVSSGRFFSRSDIWHVAGAPRSDQKGQVFVYSFPELSTGNNNLPKHIKRVRELTGSQIGEYFGAALTSCDLNNDGLDDLIVGAPLHSVVLEEGRVEVNLGSYAEGIFIIPKQAYELKGNAPRGRFGHSISCLGDLDQDSYQDVAISAPFEDTGVVYIYNGGPKGLSETYSQRIVGSEAYPGVSGFGFSLSRGQDMDGNGYVDLAVGAYRSGHALMFRSRPVIELEMDLRPRIFGALPRNSTHFEVEMCVKYSGAARPREIELVQRVNLDPRLRRVSMKGLPNDVTVHESLVMLHAETSLPDNFNCHSIQIMVKSNVQNFLDPIELSMEYVSPHKIELPQSQPLYFGWQGHNSRNQEQRVSDSFCSVCPVFKRNSRNIASTQVFYVTDCGDDNVCNSHLSMDIQYLNVSADSTFIVGSSSSLRVRVSVNNAPGSDPAYLTRAELTLPVRPVRFPAQCQEVPIENVTAAGLVFISCDVANPLNPGITRHFDLDLNMEGVSAVQGTLKVAGKAFTNSKDIEGEGNVANAALGLVANADITISGKSGNELYYFKTNEKEENGLKKFVPFKIRYQVEKFGLSPVHEVQFSVIFPVSLKSGAKFIQLSRQPQLTLNSIPFETCTMSGEQPTLIEEKVDDTKKRLKREVEREISSFPENRTMHINCSNVEWKCAELNCRVGPFPDINTFAILELFLVMEVPLIESLLGLRDIIVYGSEAMVTKMDAHVHQPDGDLPDHVFVTAAFLGQIPKSHVAGWVIAVSVMVGIIILIAIVTGLVKAGFFERKDKAALTALKSEETQYGSTNPTPVTDGQ